MELIKAKVAGLAVAQLKEMAALLMKDTREGSNLVFVAVLDALEARLPETEYAAFCDSL